ncbi:MAG: hypothetical protein WC725_01575 [Patescibacteria group bacterium]
MGGAGCTVGLAGTTSRIGDQIDRHRVAGSAPNAGDSERIGKPRRTCRKRVGHGNEQS